MSILYTLLGLFLTLNVFCTNGYVKNSDNEITWEEILRKFEENERLPEIKRVSKNLGAEEVSKQDETIQNSVDRKQDGIELDVQVDDTSTTTPASTTANNTHTKTQKPLPQIQIKPNSKKSSHSIIINTDGLFFIAIVTACSLAGLVGLIMAGICWYKLNKKVKAASEVDYPAYGVTGPTKERIGPGPGDRKLAQSAQMYHYQHQKQQMIAMEKANGEMKHDASEDESEEENEEGDYTVYECPGLAPTGEMEVRNPLFTEAPATAPGQDEQSKESQ